ncbi:MAG: DNA adenine methylase [Bacteroidota bacterium]
MREQLALFGPTRPKIINVASVPQRSPFRYPGGKTWLIPYVRQWLSSCQSADKQLIEPFAGGGVVSLTSVAEKRVREALMVELDEDVAAVWQTILSDDAEWLAHRITSFSVTHSSVESVLRRNPTSVRQKAFAVLLKNRVSHGGILAKGAGLLKHGENGKGLLSRWYPKTLRYRILDIQNYKERLKFLQADGLKVLRDNAGRTDAIFFIDPPYTVTGKRLYRYSDVNHSELFNVASTVQGAFLMTYDNADEIKELALMHRLHIAAIPMKGTHHAEKTELLISKDLSWLKKI